MKRNIPAPPENKADVAPGAEPHAEGEEFVTDDERIDEAMRESFPASDPPSWNLGLEKHEEEVETSGGGQT